MKQIEEAVKEALEQVLEFRNHFVSNEQAVRAQLIEPILIALGWRTSNAKFVRHNAPYEDGKIPDYTLLKDGKNKLIVEAKNLSITLTDSKVINQLSGYCYNQGVDYGILTNGARWLLFSMFQKNPQDRIVWEIDLEKESAEAVSRKLSSFSFDNIDRLNALLQISKALEENWIKTVTSLESIVTIVANKLGEQIRVSNPSLRIEPNEISSFTRAKLIEQFELQVGNGSEDQIQTVGVTNSKERETAFSEVENAVFKRGDRRKIAVTFPDGKRFYSNKVVDTFVDTIKTIGVEKIKPLGIVKSTVPLISERKHTGPTRYNQHKIDSYWVMVNLSTNDKYNLLQELNSRLNLGLKIEML